MLNALSFIGWHNSGKTTLLTNLINLLSENGYKIGIIKHAHADLKIPLAKDSEKLFLAGASQVYVSSPKITIDYQRQAAEKTLTELYESLNSDLDLILVEGFKEEDLPKIEVVRAEINPTPVLSPNTIALVTDIPMELDLPIFGFTEIELLLNFIISYFNLQQTS